MARIPVLLITVSFMLVVPIAQGASALSGLPNPALTPGAINPNVTQSNIHETICVRGYTRTIRPPVSYTEPLKREQLREYGYADQRIWHYAEDHLVPLEAGGAPRDPRNLWPEPHYGRWNSYKKDRIENEMHWLVCHGRISLRAAQQVFRTDWIRGYQKYVAGTHYFEPRPRGSRYRHWDR